MDRWTKEKNKEKHRIRQRQELREHSEPRRKTWVSHVFQLQIPGEARPISALGFHDTPPLSLNLYFYFSHFTGPWFSFFLLTCYQENFNWNTPIYKGWRFPYLQIWGNNAYNYRDRLRIKPEAQCLPQHQVQKIISTNRSYCITISHREAKLTLGELDPST